MRLSGKLFCVTLSILIAYSSFLISCLLFFDLKIVGDFWSFKLIDIMNLFVIGFLGFFISYFLFKRMNYFTKLQEVKYKFFNELYEQIFPIQNEVNQFVAQPDSSKRKDISLLIKSYSTKLSLLNENILENENPVLKKIVGNTKTSFEKIKELVMSETWGDDQLKYSRDTCDKIKNEFENVENYMIKAMFENCKN